MKNFLEMFRINGKSYAVTFALVSTLFFLWGFCNGMIDVLNSHFQDSLHISKMESGFVQFANFIGYFVMAIPSGLLAKRFGYKGGILLGLALIAAGAFLFVPATWAGTFAAFLTCLFILTRLCSVLPFLARRESTWRKRATLSARFSAHLCSEHLFSHRPANRIRAIARYSYPISGSPWQSLSLRCSFGSATFQTSKRKMTPTSRWIRARQPPSPSHF
jgi:hypothetical protein